MIRETEVDGVPTLVAPTSGPMQAGLVFRVGRTDETLANAGITHLVEHLALHRHGVADYHYNGSTSTLCTNFVVQGSESAIVEYLTGVCDSLADMPMHRLATEKEILRTEAAGRSDGVNQQMPLWRYGAQGHGLVSYPEWGVHRVTPDDVDHWVKTWFTRQNAVLWIAGSGVPAGLSLRLGEGTRMPITATTSALPRTPAYFSDENGKVVFDAIVRRSTAAQVYSGVLERELYRSLRQEGGYSYTAATAYDPRGDEFAVVTAVADALPAKHDAVVGGFIDVLFKLKAGRIEQGDLNAIRSKAEEAYAHPDIHAARLGGMAVNILTGQPTSSIEELREELLAVTPADVHEVAEEAMGTALLQVPRGQSADWAGFTAAPMTSETTVTGHSYPALDGSPCRYVVGAKGVSYVMPSGALTVLFDECSVVLGWPDGARRLIGKDGIIVHFEPTLFHDGATARQAIDVWGPASLTVMFPARSPDQIPQPNPSRGQGQTRIRTPREGWTRLGLSAAGSAVLLALFIVLANAWTPGDGDNAEKAIRGLMVLAFGGCGYTLLLFIQRMGRGHW